MFVKCFLLLLVNRGLLLLKKRLFVHFELFHYVCILSNSVFKATLIYTMESSNFADNAGVANCLLGILKYVLSFR